MRPLSQVGHKGCWVDEIMEPCRGHAWTPALSADVPVLMTFYRGCGDPQAEKFNPLMASQLIWQGGALLQPYLIRSSSLAHYQGIWVRAQEAGCPGSCQTSRLPALSVHSQAGRAFTQIPSLTVPQRPCPSSSIPCSKPSGPLMAATLIALLAVPAGDSVAKYIRSPQAINTQIVALGVDTYLKMLLADNFVHTDLHPGNILVRVRGVSR